MGHQVLSVVSIPPCPPSPPLCLRSSIALMPDQSFCNIKCLTEFLYTTSQMLVYHFQLLKFKCYLQCAEQLASPSNLTKYCACHEKWHHKIVKKFSENCWSVIYNARPIREWSENDPTTIRAWNRQSATRLATEVTCHAHRQHFVLKNTTFRGPAIIPNFTKYCACHEKWHSKITKYCACHAKWLSWSNLFTHETLLEVLVLL